MAADSVDAAGADDPGVPRHRTRHPADHRGLGARRRGAAAAGAEVRRPSRRCVHRGRLRRLPERRSPPVRPYDGDRLAGLPAVRGLAGGHDQRVQHRRWPGRTVGRTRAHLGVRPRGRVPPGQRTGDRRRRAAAGGRHCRVPALQHVPGADVLRRYRRDRGRLLPGGAGDARRLDALGRLCRAPAGVHPRPAHRRNAAVDDAPPGAAARTARCRRRVRARSQPHAPPAAGAGDRAPARRLHSLRRRDAARFCRTGLDVHERAQLGAAGAGLAVRRRARPAPPRLRRVRDHPQRDGDARASASVFPIWAAPRQPVITRTTSSACSPSISRRSWASACSRPTSGRPPPFARPRWA